MNNASYMNESGSAQVIQLSPVFLRLFVHPRLTIQTSEGVLDRGDGYLILELIRYFYLFLHALYNERRLLML